VLYGFSMQAIHKLEKGERENDEDENDKRQAV
jgi:hypothetical protein